MRDYLINSLMYIICMWLTMYRNIEARRVLRERFPRRVHLDSMIDRKQRQASFGTRRGTTALSARHKTARKRERVTTDS